jgi:hypothetical protein
MLILAALAALLTVTIVVIMWLQNWVDDRPEEQVSVWPVLVMGAAITGLFVLLNAMFAGTR